MKEIKKIGIYVLMAALCTMLLVMPVFAADFHLIYRDPGQGIEGRMTGPGLPPANWNSQSTRINAAAIVDL